MLAPDFKIKLGEVASIVRPFVRWSSHVSLLLVLSLNHAVYSMNDLMTIQERGDEENEDEDGENDRE